MKTPYNKSKIMRNAWYLLKRKIVKTFSAALCKAWFNEKLNVVRALAEGRTITESKALACNAPNSPEFAAGCLAYYADARSGQYFGD